MKVFISWSGEKSKAVAELMRDWLKCVIQATKPWISSKDLEKGSLWLNELSDQLKDTGIGILCLTHENKNNNWIHYEAGALAKGVTANRVYTFLVDLLPSDLENPLAQFNHTFPDKDNVFSLISNINSKLDSYALDTKTLENSFNTYWEQFECNFKKIIESNPTPQVEEREDKQILIEILESTRSFDKRLTNIERRSIIRRIPPERAREIVRDCFIRNIPIEAIEEILLREGVPPHYIPRLIEDVRQSPIQASLIQENDNMQ